MKKMPLVWTWVFVIKEKKFLLWKRKSKLWDWTWSLPWGHLEFWETLEECWKRETFEEFWINIKDIEILWVSNDIKDDKHYVTIFLFSSYEWWNINISNYDEFYEYKWTDLENLPENLFYILENFLNNNISSLKKILN